jgi:histidinol-phosphatase (PHP family)
MTGTDDPEMLKRYVDLIIKGVDTGRFTYVAHPDVTSYKGDAALYDTEMKRMLAALKEREMPIEINLLGLKDGRNYPSERFFKLASEYELPVILGCDAHSPMRVADKDEIKAAREFAKRCGIKLVENVKIVDPFAQDN